MLGPDTLFPRREDAIGIQSILDPLLQPQQCMIIPVVGLEGAERTWMLYCQGCHAEGISEHPGTLRLSHTRGLDKSAIRGRKDLSPEYIREVVRKGYLEMVGFRPTEITDEQLEELIQFIRGE